MSGPEKGISHNPEEARNNLKEREEKSHKEKIAEREKQSWSSRLCEYITGLKPEDPRILERMMTDKNIIRNKYNLPDEHLSLSEYERALRKLAETKEVKIKTKSDCGKLFEELDHAGGVSIGKDTVALSMNKKNEEEYKHSLKILEHELVHSMQSQDSPRMPIERMEYEAFLANQELDSYRENHGLIDKIFFGMLMRGSIKTNYYLQGKKAGHKIEPEWDNPEYFLKRDGIKLDKKS